VGYEPHLRYKRNPCRVFVEKSEETRPFGRPSRRCRIILNCILKEQGVRKWTEFIWRRTGSRGGAL